MSVFNLVDNAYLKCAIENAKICNNYWDLNVT